MNSKLFWSGAIFQLVQLIGLGVVVMLSIDWDIKIIALSFWALLNIASLAFMLLGSIMDEKKDYETESFK